MEVRSIRMHRRGRMRGRPWYSLQRELPGPWYGAGVWVDHIDEGVEASCK